MVIYTPEGEQFTLSIDAWKTINLGGCIMVESTKMTIAQFICTTRAKCKDKFPTFDLLLTCN